MSELKTVTLPELIDALKASRTIYYHAPMDHKPVRIAIRQYTICDDNLEYCRATIWTPATKQLTLYLYKHLDRFRIEQ